MSPDVLSVVWRAWVFSFLLTLAVEIPIFVFFARQQLKIPVWRAALAGAAGTCVTHPALWFLWPLVIHDYPTYIISGELLIAAIESLTFYALARPISWRLALAASFVANAISYGVGALLD